MSLSRVRRVLRHGHLGPTNSYDPLTSSGRTTFGFSAPAPAPGGQPDASEPSDPVAAGANADQWTSPFSGAQVLADALGTASAVDNASEPSDPVAAGASADQWDSPLGGATGLTDIVSTALDAGSSAGQEEPPPALDPGTVDIFAGRAYDPTDRDVPVGGDEPIVNMLNDLDVPAGTTNDPSIVAEPPPPDEVPDPEPDTDDYDDYDGDDGGDGGDGGDGDEYDWRTSHDDLLAFLDQQRPDWSGRYADLEQRHGALLPQLYEQTYADEAAMARRAANLGTGLGAGAQGAMGAAQAQVGLGGMQQRQQALQGWQQQGLDLREQEARREFQAQRDWQQQGVTARMQFLEREYQLALDAGRHEDALELQRLMNAAALDMQYLDAISNAGPDALAYLAAQGEITLPSGTQPGGNYADDIYQPDDDGSTQGPTIWDQQGTVEEDPLYP